MAKIRVHEESSLPWIGIDPAKMQEQSGEATSEGSAYRIHEMGTDTSPQLFEIHYAPDVAIEVHAHAHDEILYVLDGGLRLGNRMLGKGSSLFVSADTLYSFAAGPKGVTFLNFRPLLDTSYVRKDEFLAHRAASRSASVPSQVA